ncbi:MAG: cell division protein ZapA, partial [Oscillospiraceae bacterium]|nr:cell division protein ZapA [Oscillospiraceae bacterium]
MLNEKVTVVICGKNYRLRTDNAKQLYAAATDVDVRITEYCGADHNMGKEDAAVLAALDCFNELNEFKAKCAALSAETEKLKKNEAAAKTALEEC